jgi:hypothetical protein
MIATRFQDKTNTLTNVFAPFNISTLIQCNQEHGVRIYQRHDITSRKDQCILDGGRLWKIKDSPPALRITETGGIQDHDAYYNAWSSGD